MGAGAEVAPHLQQHDVIQLILPLAARLPQVGQPPGVGLVGEKTAAPGRLGIVGETEPLRQGHLGLAGAAAEVVQPLPVHPPLPLRQRGRKILGTERAKQAITHPGLPHHHLHGIAPLGHGTLADHLPGDDEIEAVRLDPLHRPAHHETLAVQAGVEIGPVTVFGIDHHPLVGFGDIDDVQLDPQLFRHPERVVALRLVPIPFANGVSVPLHTEAGIEIDPFHVDALLHHHPGCQHGIQPAGDEGQRLALLCHVLPMSPCEKGYILANAGYNLRFSNHQPSG